MPPRKAIQTILPLAGMPADAGCVWFSLKDPALLRSTVFRMESHGRHGRPWNRRNNCLGMEDGTANFAVALTASTRENRLTKDGVDTAIELRTGAA